MEMAKLVERRHKAFRPKQWLFCFRMNANKIPIEIQIIVLNLSRFYFRLLKKLWKMGIRKGAIPKQVIL